MMIGSRPVFKILLRHVFWSTRNHTTYFAFGFWRRSDSKHMLMDIPVASGRTMQSFTSVMPHMWMKSSDSLRVSSHIMDDPAAFGYA